MLVPSAWSTPGTVTLQGFFFLPESEARAEPCEVAVAGFARGWLSEPEEGVALHSALPQVLAALGAGQLEHEGMLLLPGLKIRQNKHCLHPIHKHLRMSVCS